MMQHMAGQAVTGRAPPPMPAREGAWAIYEPFVTEDGEQIFVGLTSDGQWRRFCEHFGRGDLLQNPAYKTNEDRVRERPALRPIVAEIVARHKLAELAEFSTASIFPLRRWQNPATCSTIRNSMPAAACSTIEFSNGTRAKIPRLPIEIGDHDFALRRQAPALGEHAAEILAELGLAPAEIAALRQRGIIAGQWNHERSADCRTHQ